MFVAIVLHYSWEGRTWKAQIGHLKTMATKKTFSDKIILQYLIILRSKSMAQLIIPIRVWLDSYPAHKIHKIFTTTSTTTTTTTTTTTITTTTTTTTTATTITATEFSLGGISSYTSTDKTNKNKHT